MFDRTSINQEFELLELLTKALAGEKVDQTKLVEIINQEKARLEEPPKKAESFKQQYLPAKYWKRTA